MKDLLLYNLKYDAWANERQAVSLMVKEENTGLSKARQWMSHILLASGIWADRVEGLPVTRGAWETIPAADFQRVLTENLNRWERILESENENCDRPISYQNLQGVAFETPLFQILTHLTHHGAYHRGQIASVLKNSGLEVPPTDAIVYSRLF
jgi:uncharacterized damage-inducible protein DinB